jgi:hypothetical protein
MVPNAARGKRVRCTYCSITLKVPGEKKDYFDKAGIIPKNITPSQEAIS